MEDHDVWYVDKNGNHGIFIGGFARSIALRIALNLMDEELTSDAWVQQGETVVSAEYGYNARGTVVRIPCMSDVYQSDEGARTVTVTAIGTVSGVLAIGYAGADSGHETGVLSLTDFCDNYQRVI